MLIDIHQNDLNHGMVTADEQLFLRGRALSVRPYAIVAGRQWATRGLKPQEPTRIHARGKLWLFAAGQHRLATYQPHAISAGRQCAANAPPPGP